MGHKHFWEEFIAYAEANTPKTQPISFTKPGPGNSVDTHFGCGGAYIALTVNARDAPICVQLRILDDEPLFETLRLDQEQIDKELGEKPDWHPDTEPKVRQIRLRGPAGMDVKDEKTWPVAFEWLLSKTKRFLAVFPNRVTQAQKMTKSKP